MRALESTMACGNRNPPGTRHDLLLPGHFIGVQRKSQISVLFFQDCDSRCSKKILQFCLLFDDFLMHCHLQNTLTTGSTQIQFDNFETENSELKL